MKNNIFSNILEKCKSCRFSHFSFDGKSVLCGVTDSFVILLQDCPLLYPSCEFCAIYENCAGGTFICSDFKFKEVNLDEKWYE